MSPKKITAKELAAVLSDMAQRVEHGDSFEGSIEYTSTDEQGAFEVLGSYRVGNSEGQGDIRLIGEPTQYAPPPEITA